MEIPGYGTSVAGGESGWIVGISGGRGPAVLTSADAVNWKVRSIEAQGWPSLVHSGVSGLWVAVMVERSAEIHHSTDGGQSWDVGLLPGDGAWPLWLGEAAGDMYAAGIVGTDDPWPGGDPALWRWENAAWSQVLLEGEQGWVGAVVEWQGRAYALGSALGPAVWSADGDLEVLVGRVGGGGFVSAIVHNGRLWATVAPDPNGEGWVMVADSPERWSITEPVARGSFLASVDGNLVVRQGSVLEIVGEGVVPVRPRYTGLATGREDNDWVAAIGGWGDIGLIAGERRGQSRLWVRSTGSEETLNLAQPAKGWVPIRKMPGQVLSGARWQNRVLVATEHGIWEVEDDSLEFLGQIQSYGWVEFVPTRDALYLSTVVGWWRLEGSLLVPDAFLPAGAAQVTVADGALRVVTDDNRVWERRDRSWYELGVSRLQVAGSIPGGFVAWSEKGLAVTTDGTTFEAAPGLQGWQSGVPFIVLESRPTSSLIRIVEDWPNGREMTVPTRTPLELVVIGNEIRVWSATGLFVSTDGGVAWRRIPSGIEHGLPLTPVLLPTDGAGLAGQLPDGSSWIFRPASAPPQWYR